MADTSFPQNFVRSLSLLCPALSFVSNSLSISSYLFIIFSKKAGIEVKQRNERVREDKEPFLDLSIPFLRTAFSVDSLSFFSLVSPIHR